MAVRAFLWGMLLLVTNSAGEESDGFSGSSGDIQSGVGEDCVEPCTVRCFRMSPHSPPIYLLGVRLVFRGGGAGLWVEWVEERNMVWLTPSRHCTQAISTAGIVTTTANATVTTLPPDTVDVDDPLAYLSPLQNRSGCDVAQIKAACGPLDYFGR